MCTGTHKYTGIQYICNFLKSISTILCMLLLSNELIIIDYNNNEYVYWFFWIFIDFFELLNYVSIFYDQLGWVSGILLYFRVNYHWKCDYMG